MDYNYLSDKKLDSLKNEISILDVNHCSLTEYFFTITGSTNGINSNFDFLISGENKTFKGSFKNSNITLNTCDDFSVFYLKSTVDKTKKEIFNNELQNNAISKVTSTGFGEYKVSFYNLAKGESEYFEMVSDKHLRICNIFYGDKQKEAPVVCKMIRKRDRCEVRISSKVDYIFMIGLASFFFCKGIYAVNKVSNDNYDTMARVGMPTVPSMVKIEMPKDRLNKERYINEPEKKNNSKILALLGGCVCCYCCCKHSCCSCDEDGIGNRVNEFSMEDVCELGCCCMDCCGDSIGEGCVECCAESGNCIGELIGGCTIM